MGESRNELLSWLNDLLQLNITKVEQCGTGAALCQIYDSIFRTVTASSCVVPAIDCEVEDVPMFRVKFNVNTEYAYLQNFKILQNTFTRHSIDRLVPVEALIKCKMQDNLEFLQWTKRFWDQYYPGGEYDAISRRKSSGAHTANSASGTSRTSGASTARRGVTPTAGGLKPGRASGAGAGSTALASENFQLKETVTGLERERDFYFSKLRDIELLIQQAIEQNPDIEKDEEGLVKQIQAILYSTEDGFEIPAEGTQDDLETF